MEEIGKLIELLNEYEKELNTGLHWRIDEKYGMLWRGLNLMGVDQYLISKHYGFIKWLVENDKIDIKKLVVKGEMRSGWDFENKKGDEEEGEEIWNKYYSELCLMLLSISDTPIEDLISYLK